MKAKVTLTDNYSGRSINIVCDVMEDCNTCYTKYVYDPSLISDYQRRKIEGFFGKMNAYHTHAEIIKLIPTAHDIIAYYNDNGGFDNWHHWTLDELTEYIMDNEHCSYSVAREVALYYR